MRNTGTVYQSKDRWYTGNFVRFFRDTIQPIGGWTKRTLTGATIIGVPNAALAFTAVTGSTPVPARYVAVGTSRGYLYVVNTDTNVVTDITPAAPGGPATTNAGSFVVGRPYRITSSGTTNFTLIGAADSNVGTTFTATGVGSGSGTAQDDTEAVWQLASFGRYLIAAQGSRYFGTTTFDYNYLYVWKGDVAADCVRCDTAATAGGGISDDPYAVNGCVVTPERFLFALCGATPNSVTYPPTWVP